jgi:hypothetical protein
MRIVSLGGLAVVGLAVTLGCGGGKGGYQASPSAKIEPATVKGGIESLFPLEVGNEWTYTVEARSIQGNQEGTGAGEIMLRVAKVDQVPEGRKATVELVIDGNVRERQVWLVKPDGIYQVAAGAEMVQFSSPQPVILMPAEAGQKFTWKGSGILPGGATGASTVDHQIRGSQEVDTDMGRLAGIAVESNSRFRADNSDGVGTTMLWFAPNVGIVRSRVEYRHGNKSVVQVIRLKSHSLKK